LAAAVEQQRETQADAHDDGHVAEDERQRVEDRGVEVVIARELHEVAQADEIRRREQVPLVEAQGGRGDDGNDREDEQHEQARTDEYDPPSTR